MSFPTGSGRRDDRTNPFGSTHQPPVYLPFSVSSATEFQHLIGAIRAAE